MIILAIDPGPTESAYVGWDTDAHELCGAGKVRNEEMLLILTGNKAHCVIEMIGHYGTGMPAGREVFETCVWIGRFIEAHGAERCERILRPTVKTRLCGTPRAKDANVRQALIDRFGPPGTKKRPGKLYGISGDMWSALAVAVAWWNPILKEAVNG